MPAMPNTRLLSTFAVRYAQYVMTSRGLDTMTKMASGLCFMTFSVTVFTMPAFVAIKSSRLIPACVAIHS